MPLLVMKRDKKESEARTLIDSMGTWTSALLEPNVQGPALMREHWSST